MRTRLTAVLATVTVTVAAAIAATGASTGALVASTADDQARADAAVAAFSDQMTELGYISEGPPDLIEDPEDVAEDEFGGCFGDFETTLASLATPAEGESARAYSDEFNLIAEPVGADPSASETTDFLDFAEASEFASALVVTFDEANGDRAEQFVTLMGADKTAECFRQQLEQTMVGEDGAEDSAASAELSIEVTSESELSVGERSASLTFSVDSNLMGESLVYAVDLHAAQVDRSVAVVLHGTFGDVEPAGFDYASALAVVADSLAG